MTPFSDRVVPHALIAPFEPLFADDADLLRHAAGEIAALLTTELELRLKARATRLAPSHVGLPFLGFVLYPRLRRVRPENLRRAHARLRQRRRQHASGRISTAQYLATLASVSAHLDHGQTRRLRARWFAHGAFDP